jgi:hypothetical protein
MKPEKEKISASATWQRNDLEEMISESIVLRKVQND